jgi:hypothetical protein
VRSKVNPLPRATACTETNETVDAAVVDRARRDEEQGEAEDQGATASG